MTHYDDDLEAHSLPFLLWVILLFQARAWVVLVMAAASRQQTTELLSFWAPDNHTLLIGLVFGFPALAVLAFSGYRQRFPRIWSQCRYLLWGSGAALLIWQLSQWNQATFEQSPLLLLFTVFDLLTELALLFMRPLQDCFRQQRIDN